MSARPLVWLLDGHYEIFRAYHALPDMRAPDGSPVGAVRGFAQTLIRFLREHRPSHAAAVFDFALTSFRNELHPGYKHGRTEAPEDLEPQFDRCRAAARALGLAALEAEGYEADDVIATLVCALGPSAEVRIASRDKDLAALVSERVDLFDLARGERSGPKEVEARLGVPPALVPDLLSLMGDAVDRIPGVRGIGRSTALALLRRFGSIDAIPADAAAWREAGVRGADRALRALVESREDLALSRELVRLRDDVPVTVTLDELRWRGPDPEACERLFVPLGLGGLLARLPAAEA
jgi:DNA polymerase-1